MRSHLAWLSLLFAVSTCGCGTSWSFQGGRGESIRPAVTSTALRVYAPDVDKVKQAPGAVILGEMQVDSYVFGGWSSVRETASLEAAKLGGTHFTLLSQWTETKYSVPHAIYVVIRVPPESWPSLPQDLRPARL